jgi:hypothetical protein
LSVRVRRSCELALAAIRYCDAGTSSAEAASSVGSATTADEFTGGSKSGDEEITKIVSEIVFVRVV